MATGNAINANSAGLVRYDGAGTFSGVTTTQFDVLVGAASNGISNVGPGTAGQVLQSGGNAANPSYSTATYPSTAGTSGNLLTSDGTNWVSTSASAGLVLITAKVTLTSAQIKSLSTSPITLLAAPGANKMINIVAASIRFNYAGTNQFTGGSVMSLYENSSVNSNYVTMSVFSAAIINAAATTAQTRFPSLINGSGIDFTNQPIIVGVSGADYAGNAANDNTIEIQFAYFISSL